MPTFAFSILSPRGKAFEGPAQSVSAPGTLGGFGLLAGHTPMIAAVQPGLTKVEADDKTEYYFTGEGVMEVTRHESVLLVDEAEKVESPEAARECLQKRLAKQAPAKGNS
jgi:F-type H+-transporting ATPase subunit epsilon